MSFQNDPDSPAVALDPEEVKELLDSAFFAARNEKVTYKKTGIVSNAAVETGFSEIALPKLARYVGLYPGAVTLAPDGASTVGHPVKAI